MKRFYLLTLLAIAYCCQLAAQNVQLHYDFGHSLYDELKERPKLTSTVEMFKPDKWGSTFFFVDMDYGDGEVQSAYWEIARELKFWEGPLSLHVEYNGGIKYIKDAYLAGLTNTYKMYDNFTVMLDAAYVALWLDDSRSTWGKNPGRSTLGGDGVYDAWNVNLSFVYSF